MSSQDTRYRTDEGAGVCVGRPVDGITVKIIRLPMTIPEWCDDLGSQPNEWRSTVGHDLDYMLRQFPQGRRPRATGLLAMRSWDDVGVFDDRDWIASGFPKSSAPSQGIGSSVSG